MEDNKPFLTRKRYKLCIKVIIALIYFSMVVFTFLSIDGIVDISTFEPKITNYPSDYRVDYFAIDNYYQFDYDTYYFLATSRNEFVSISKMPAHDSKGVVIRKYQPMMAVKITCNLKENRDAFFIGLESYTDFYYSVENYLTNCIKITSATRYDNILIKKPSDITQSFVSIINDVPVKSQKINLIKSSLSSGYYEFWFIIEYNDKVIEHLHEKISHLTNNYVYYYYDLYWRFLND